jgi:hypothetical protein
MTLLSPRLLATLIFHSTLLFIGSTSVALAQTCTANATTISSNCANLVITSPNLTVTIDNGVTVSGGGSIALWNKSTATSTSIINNGTITTFPSGNEQGFNQGTITSLLNVGTISGNYHFFNAATIGTLTNTGSITGTFRGIYNTGTIGVLNNLQGASSSALSVTDGNRPSQYNIIIQSPTNYGQINAAGSTGSMAFNIYGNTGTTLVSGVNASAVTANRYLNVLQGFTSLSGVTGTTGTYGSYTYSLVSNATLANSWDLLMSLLVTGPSSVNTQSSLANTVSALQNIYSLQNSVLANSFSYDCSLFDKNNVCISAGGRNTAVSAANGLNNTSGLLIAAYRPHMNYRIGAYVDQNLSVNNAGSTVNLGNNTPLIGLFGAWNERLDGTGAEVKVTAAYSQKNTTVTRGVVGTGATASEAGDGGSNLNSQGAQAVVKYGIGVAENVIVSPYAGIRYTQNNMGGYTEGSSSSVTAPLAYSALNTNATTALAGVGTLYRFIPQATAFASVGVETDTNTANGTYSATGVTGLTPINFNANPVKTRPTAMVGAAYDIAKNQRLGVTGIYRQEPYQAVSTTTVMATYTVGL